MGNRIKGNIASDKFGENTISGYYSATAYGPESKQGSSHISKRVMRKLFLILESSTIPNLAFYKPLPPGCNVNENELSLNPTDTTFAQVKLIQLRIALDSQKIALRILTT